MSLLAVYPGEFVPFVLYSFVLWRVSITLSELPRGPSPITRDLVERRCHLEAGKIKEK